MELEKNLQKFRRFRGLSQEELAEECQISRQAIAKWESGESVPTIDKLIFLADFYKVSLDELVGRKTDIELMKEFVKRFVPEGTIPTGDDDALQIICRFIDFLDKHGFSAEDKLSAVQEVFLIEDDN